VSFRRLLRLLPLALVLYFAANSGGEVRSLLGIGHQLRAEMELASIAGVVSADLAEDRPIPLDGFEDYLRERMKARARDPALDPWGYPYGILLYEGRYTVYSLGPDSVPDTEDDVEVAVE
jgi:hypothetical protein